MKLLEIAEFYSKRGGGVHTYVENKFEAAARHGVDLTVLAPGPEDRVEIRRGGRLLWVKSPPIPVDPRYHLFWKQRPIDEIVADTRPDFIEGASPWRGAWIAARQPRSIARALFIHQDPVLTYPQTMFRRFASPAAIDRQFAWFHRYFRRLQAHFDVSIVASRWLAERLAKAGMAAPLTIGMGVEPAPFSPLRRSEALRAEMLAACGMADARAKLLISVSRHHPEKRLLMLIDAIGRASRLNPLALYLIGDGPDRRSVEKAAARTPGVHVAGFIDDRVRIAALLASADAYIHGCPSETYGLVIAEALASGLPQIVPDRGGASELPSLDSAEFFDADQAASCAAAIERYLQRDHEPMRAAALRDCARIGTLDDHFRKLFALYAKLREDHAMRRNLTAMGDYLQNAGAWQAAVAPGEAYAQQLAG